jgi:PHD/YefM family antitoxin component YafN of YafNO toxin-antitoxin module
VLKGSINMATQTVTVQVDQVAATIQPATVTEIEATGKTTADLLAQMKAAHQPVYLNFDNGESLVVLNLSDYQRLVEAAESIREDLDLDELDLAESREAVRQGLADAAAGRTMSLSEFAAKMRANHGFAETRPVRQ